MTHDRMLRAIERLADDRRFAARFRQDPERALRRYRLDSAQIDAIKAGDPTSLAAHGIDVRDFAVGHRHGIRSRIRKMAVAVTVVAGFVGISAGPVAAKRRMGARLDGIWNLGHASERSGHDLKENVGHVEVPTDGVPGQGRPFHLR